MLSRGGSEISTAIRSTASRATLAACVLALDGVIRLVQPGYAVLGLLDEPAHLATTALFLSATVGRRWPRRAWVAALLSSVLIDLDHLPAAAGFDVLTDGTPRPYTHSITTVGCLLALALVTRPRPAAAVLLGCAAGVGAHLVRDVATAPVALWWPLSDDGLRVSYGYYLLLMVVAVLPVRRLVHAVASERTRT
jgi:inner membrane protein